MVKHPVSIRDLALVAVGGRHVVAWQGQFMDGSVLQCLAFPVALFLKVFRGFKLESEPDGTPSTVWHHGSKRGAARPVLSIARFRVFDPRIVRHFSRTRAV